MDHLTKRQRTLIEKYISTDDPSLNAIEKCISDRQIQMARYIQDIKNIQSSIESKIGILTEFKRIKVKTPLQQIILEDCNPGFIQLEAKLFQDALEEKIKDIELDISGLQNIRDVFLDRFGEDALSNPSSPRSELELNPSPTLVNRRSKFSNCHPTMIAKIC